MVSCEMGKKPRIVFIYLHYRSMQGWTTGCPTDNGMTNSGTETCVWNWGVLLRELGSCFPWRRECITLSVRSSGSAFCRNYPSTKGPCRSWQELVKQIVGTTNTVYCFRKLSIISTSLFYALYTSVMLSIYAKHCSLSLHALWEPQYTCKELSLPQQEFINNLYHIQYRAC